MILKTPLVLQIINILENKTFYSQGMYCPLRMELAAYLQENAILLLSRSGAFEPFFQALPWSFCMNSPALFRRFFNDRLKVLRVIKF